MGFRHWCRLVGRRQIIPHPVDYRTATLNDRIGWNLSGNLEVLNIAIKEWVGRLANRLTGWCA
jgi:hypothetical protein